MKKLIEILKTEIPLPKVSERHKLIGGWITTIIYTVLFITLSFQIYRLFDIHLSILPKVAVLERECNLQQGVAEEIKIIKFYLLHLLVVEFLMLSCLYEFVSGIRKRRKKLVTPEE